MRKRYIIVCAACDKLGEVSRNDAITCGGGCRVRLHRHPELLDLLRKHATDAQVPLFGLLEMRALRLLIPERQWSPVIFGQHRREFTRSPAAFQRMEHEAMEKLRPKMVRAY